MPRRNTPSATHFVVRLNWRRAGSVFVRVPGERRVDVFPDGDAATARVRQLEAEARGKVNAFCCGAVWAGRCSMPEPVFRDFIRDAGVDPPADTDLAKWWAAVAADVTPEANVHLWHWLFTDHRFYAVVRVLVEE